MFNPESSVPQLWEAVEMLFCCLIAFKRAFPCPVHAMSGLESVLSHQGIIQLLNRQKTNSESFLTDEHIELAQWKDK